MPYTVGVRIAVRSPEDVVKRCFCLTKAEVKVLDMKKAISALSWPLQTCTSQTSLICLEKVQIKLGTFFL